MKMIRLEFKTIFGEKDGNRVENYGEGKRSEEGRGERGVEGGGNDTRPKTAAVRLHGNRGKAMVSRGFCSFRR